MSLFFAAMFAAGIAQARTNDFWTYWGDGKAELDGYNLVQPRYGQLREGKAVLIFVTEDHSVKEMVKIEGDPTRVPAAERFSVFKLNFVKTFQTGIYDYKVLTSVFTRIDQNFAPSKISLSVQEWCGHVYQQILFKANKAYETLHSYFGGEGDQEKKWSVPANAVAEDTVPILIRELKQEWVKPGGSLDVPCAPSLLSLRFFHKPFSWERLHVEKSVKPEKLRCALGTVPATRWTVRTAHAGVYTYFVEADWPHRILKWSSDQGEYAELTGSVRLPYWKLHDNGDERYLQKLFPK